MCISIDCGTIIHGTTQDVDMASAPSDAEVWVDGAKMGTTPTRITLKRNDSHMIKFTKDGYEPVEVKIETEISAWIIGNIIFGGIIGCGIDFISGGAYNLDKERLDIVLPKIEASNDRTIYLEEAQIADLKEIRVLGEENEPIFVVAIDWVAE